MVPSISKTQAFILMSLAEVGRRLSKNNLVASAKIIPAVAAVAVADFVGITGRGAKTLNELAKAGCLKMESGHYTLIFVPRGKIGESRFRGPIPPTKMPDDWLGRITEAVGSGAKSLDLCVRELPAGRPERQPLGRPKTRKGKDEILVLIAHEVLETNQGGSHGEE